MYQFKNLTYHDVHFDGGGLLDAPYGMYHEKRIVHGPSMLFGLDASFGHFILNAFAGAGYKWAKVTDNYIEYHTFGDTPDTCPCSAHKYKEHSVAVHLSVKIGDQFGPIVGARRNTTPLLK
jgi:hypothetical protein